MKFNAKQRMSLLAVLLILVIGALIYANTLQVPFVFDDLHAITQNKIVEHPENVLNAYKLGLQHIENRFIAYLSFSLNYRLGGLDVTGYHLVNLAIHLLSGLIVYALLRLTFRTPYFEAKVKSDSGSGLSSTSTSTSTSTWFSSLTSPPFFIPLFAALLFIAHPVQTQAVTYIVQRMTSLTTMFFLLSLVLYVKARLQIEEKPACRTKLILSFAGSVLSALLAMKTKEIAFTLPLVAVLYELFFFKGAWLRRLLYLLPLLATLPVIPLTVLGLLDIGIDEKAAEEWRVPQDEPLRVQTSMSRLSYLFTQFRVIVTYLRLLVFPTGQNIDYDYPVYENFFSPVVFSSFALLAALVISALALFFLSRKSSPGDNKKSAPFLRLMSFGILWFFLTLSVESSLIPIKDLIMEHRLYLPSFGAFTTLSALIFLLMTCLTEQHSGKLLILSASMLILIIGVATYQRNNIWRDSLRLWQDSVTKSPNKARPLNNFGKALEDSGRRSEAISVFKRVIKLDPTYYKAYYNLADLYLVNGQPEKSLPLLQTAIGLKSDFTEAYVAAGAALMRSGRFNDVINFFERYRSIVADNAEAHFYLGASYAFLGDRAAAERELQLLSRSDPQLAANLRSLLR